MLALFAAGFAAAAALSVLVLPEKVLLTFAALSLSAVLLTAAFLRRDVSPVLRRYLLLLCAGAAVGFLWTWSYARIFHDPVRRLDGHTILLEAEVTGWPAKTASGYELDARAALPGGGRAAARLYLNEGGSGLRPGDTLRARAKCRFSGHTAGGEETNYYTARGILLTAHVDGEPAVERPERIPFRRLPAFLSQRLKQGIAASCPADSAGLVTALVTGDRSGLDDDFTAALRRTGLSHAVAVSGMHMAFLIALLSLLFRSSGRLRTVVCLLATAIFAMMTGGTPSVVRAAVMVDLLLIAPLVGRERDELTALGAALLLLLAHDPYAVADVGLQLSFAAVLGILLFTERLTDRILAAIGPGKGRGRLWTRLTHAAAGSLGATFGALVFTVPLTAVHFGSVSLIAPLSNLIVLWAVSLSFTFGILGGAVGALIPALGTLIAWPSAMPIRIAQRLVPALARIPFASISMEDVFSRVWLLLLYAILAATLFTPLKKRLWIPACACVVSLCIALCASVLSLRAGELTVQALDVGQGQSVLIRSGGSFMLCDCGGDYRHDAGRIAAEHLERAAGRTIRLLVLSHYDEDHVNGVPTLLDTVNVSRSPCRMKSRTPRRERTS